MLGFFFTTDSSDVFVRNVWEKLRYFTVEQLLSKIIVSVNRRVERTVTTQYQTVKQKLQY